MQGQNLSGNRLRLACGLALALAVGNLAAPMDQEFLNYPGDPPLESTAKAPRMDTRFAREYRTQLREAAEKGPDFGGRYALASWGCGTNCLELALIDLSIGKVHETAASTLPGCLVPRLSEGKPAVWADYRLDSRLLYLYPCQLDNPCQGEDEIRRDAYLWNGKRFEMLKTECLKP